MGYELKTDFLLDQLINQTDIHTYIDRYHGLLDKDRLIIRLNKLLIKRNMTIADIGCATQLAKSYIYKIFSGEKTPSKDKLLQISFSLSCTLEDTQELLRYAGHSPLYSKIKRESIIIFAINKQLSIYDTNNLLVEYKEKPLFNLY